MNIEIKLQKDRTIPGLLIATKSTGERIQMRCLGLADLTAALAHGNPTLDPLKPFGNLGTGTYQGYLTVAAPNTPQDLRSYGPYRRIALHGISGDALKGKLNGRAGELIHGGAPSATGGLRPTHGCARVDDVNMELLAEFCDGESISVYVSE